MNHLIPDFVLNPVLRQARRFSRPNTTGDLEEQTNQHADVSSRDEAAILDINEQMESGVRLEAGAEEILGAGSWPPSSPFNEDGRLSCRPSRTQAVLEQSHMAQLRLSSDSQRTESEVSDDPPFGLRDALSGISPVQSPSSPSAQSSSQSLPTGRHRNSSLPADDGMSALRQQILHIQAMGIPMEQKARLMHRLLAQEYYRSQEAINAKGQPRSPSPESMISQERPTSPGSLSSFLWHMNGAVDDLSPDEHYTFHLSPDDLKRTYAPLDPVEVDEEDVARDKEEAHILGCRHYRRNVKLQCSTCDRWYTCRLCHDEVEDHVLIRHATKNMLCMICGTAQRAGEFCAECGERTAWYYCGVCKLWDNDSNKSIYHCNDCGICRKGRGLGKDFFHCKTCGVCLPMSVEHSHKCIERVSDCDCPICGEYMFTSPRPVVFMLCGHSIHQTCYYDHMKSSYKCPICNKSTINMETQFRNMDRAIDNQPMPPQFQDTKAMVSCNDCYAKSAVKYHWLGLKCAICDSYNTVQLSILSDPAVSIPEVESREAGDCTVAEQGVRDRSSSNLLAPGPTRYRRHSSYMYPADGSLEVGRLSPHSVRQRIARSVSPMHRRGFLDSFAAIFGGDTDDSEYEDDDLDFWGRDGPRSTTTAENIEDVEETDSEDDSASAADDCDEGDDEDQFELLGHR